jgi:hypothetical protein
VEVEWAIDLCTHTQIKSFVLNLILAHSNRFGV